jgi:intracellular multiplication protein IcmK
MGTSNDLVLPPPPRPTSAPSSLAIDASQLNAGTAQAEQAALQAEAKAEDDKRDQQLKHNRESFDRAEAGLLPLSPDQIQAFMRRLDATQEAAVPPPDGPPEGKVRINTLSLDPGAEPPQINLAAGYVTTINIVDATGEPWPILDVGIGGNFEVSPTQAGSHIVRVMALTRHGAGNLSLLLKDLPTPVIFRLSAGGPSVDLRYDARVPKFGPNAKPAIIDRPRLEAGSADMMLILQNAPPKGAQRLKVSGLDDRTKAWSMGDKVFIRTPLALLSPAWNSSVASDDGMTVYEIGDAPVLLMSDNGAMVRARLIRDDNQ